jgi:hypothetical protein
LLVEVNHGGIQTIEYFDTGDTINGNPIYSCASASEWVRYIHVAVGSMGSAWVVEHTSSGGEDYAKGGYGMAAYKYISVGDSSVIGAYNMGSNWVSANISSFEVISSRVV